MTDIQLIDQFVENYCRTGCVNPFLLRDLEVRRIAYIVNFLPNNLEEAKAIVRARIAAMGWSYGDSEIDAIADTIRRIDHLRNKLNDLNIADVHHTLPLLREMTELSEGILEYYKTPAGK